MKSVVFAAAGLAFFTAAARADDNLDNLQAMYMLSASQEICGLAMSEAEAAKLAKASAMLEERLGFDQAKAEAFFAKVKGAVESQKADMCNASGEWAQTYAAALAGLPE
jgi:hypothetical protein